MEKLVLTAREVTHLILAAAMLNDQDIAQIGDKHKGVQATVLKIQAASNYDDNTITTPAWEIIAERRSWF